MVWSEQRDLTLLKEIAAEGVLTKKEKSRERGSGWQTAAENLCPVFNIELSSRSVRDHYSMLSRKHKTRLAREERATGEGGEELTEKEALLEELMQIEEETEIQMGEEMVLRKETAEMEKAKGLEMRERAMECYGETRKRVLEHLGKEKKPQKRRKSGEMFDWLNKRVEVEMENKEKERRERQEEREVWQQQLYLQQQQQQQQFSMLQQQMMAMMHQQQQQTQAMFELLRQGRE